MDKAAIEIRECVVAASVGGRGLQGDLYLPQQAAENGHPAVVLVYGGSWRTGEPSQQKVYGLALAKAGFVCLATEHRFSTEAQWPAQLEDVATAVRWLRAHAKELDVDPQRIAISGNSSGGHLALMVTAAAVSMSSAQQQYWPEFSNHVSAVCAFYPPTRLSLLDAANGDDTVRNLLGAEATVADYDAASPLEFAAQSWPPTLLLSGAADDRVPVEQTYQMHEALAAAGNTVELHVFAGQGHAFDGDREMARVCAAILVNFFQRYV